MIVRGRSWRAEGVLHPQGMTKHVRSVLMTADAVGGIWTYALDLGRECVRRGFRVELAVLGPGLDDAKRQSAAAAGLALTQLSQAPEWLATGSDEVAKAGAALADLARSRSVDLIHLNHPALAAQTSFGAAVLAACHSCVATWWEAVKGSELPPEFAWQADLVGRGYRRAQILVAPSRAFAETTQRLYGLSRLPEVVHNGRAVHPESQAPSDPVEAVFTAGRLWDEGKNARVLDRVAALTIAPFRAAGPTVGPNGATVSLKHLEALGPLPEAQVQAHLAERPVYVSAALFEPFGLAVLEAAQAGCPLVLSDIDTFRELWSDAALFVPAQDEEGFAAAIGRLLSDAELRAEYAHAARNRARAFGLDAFVGDMIDLYDGLLAGGNGANRAA